MSLKPIPNSITQNHAGSHIKILLVLLIIGITSLLTGACNSSVKIPDFTVSLYQGVEELGGTEISVTELLQHDKPVILNFWGALCGTCIHEMPGFQSLHERMEDEVIIVGIDIGHLNNLGTEHQGRELLKELNISYPNGTTFDREALKSIGVIALPLTIFLTPQGEIHRQWLGYLEEQRLLEFIDDLLKVS